MKRFILSAALAVALTGSLAFAQQTPANGGDNGAPQHHRHHQPDPHKAALHISQKLNLTPDQTAKLEPILAGREQKVAALRADSSLTPEQRHEKIHAVHQDTEQQLAGVLTPDQLQQLKAMHKGHHGHDKGEAMPNA